MSFYLASVVWIPELTRCEWSLLIEMIPITPTYFFLLKGGDADHESSKTGRQNSIFLRLLVRRSARAIS
jgi:hypothetical protein